MDHNCKNNEDAIYFLEYNKYDARWYFDADGRYIGVSHCPWCGTELHIVAPVERPEPPCRHGQLQLSGHDYEPPDGTLFIRELSLRCLDCNSNLLYIPNDVLKIVNIPHPAQTECEHPGNTREYHLCGFGSSTCLQCGKYFGPASPSVKLHISGAT
jgi:hypothetical protein